MASQGGSMKPVCKRLTHTNNVAYRNKILITEVKNLQYRPQRASSQNLFYFLLKLTNQAKTNFFAEEKVCPGKIEIQENFKAFS